MYFVAVVVRAYSYNFSFSHRSLCMCLIEKDFIGLDRSGQRVLMLSADSDLDKLSIRISELKRSS